MIAFLGCVGVMLLLLCLLVYVCFVADCGACCVLLLLVLVCFTLWFDDCLDAMGVLGGY